MTFDFSKEHPIFFAAYKGDEEGFKNHINSDLFDINLTDSQNKSTVIMFLAEAGHLNLLKFIKDKLPNLNWQTIFQKNNVYGSTAWLLAAFNGHLDVMQWLYKEKLANINSGTNYGNTAWLNAARGDHIDVMQWLYKENLVNVNDKNIDGDNVLMLASWKGNNAVTQWLLINEFVPVDAKNNDGDTALRLARKNGHKQVARSLILAGASVEKELTGKQSRNFYNEEFILDVAKVHFKKQMFEKGIKILEQLLKSPVLDSSLADKVNCEIIACALNEIFSISEEKERERHINYIMLRAIEIKNVAKYKETIELAGEYFLYGKPALLRYGAREHTQTLSANNMKLPENYKTILFAPDKHSKYEKLHLIKKEFQNIALKEKVKEQEKIIQELQKQLKAINAKNNISEDNNNKSPGCTLFPKITTF